jgi:hypothetical protein
LVDWARAHEMPAKTINAALERLKKTDFEIKEFTLILPRLIFLKLEYLQVITLLAL